MRKLAKRSPPGTATITDVARQLGVSTSTVSRALTRPQLLKPETRKRVLSAVERLGYRPNLLARGLKSGHARAIVFITPNLSPFFMEIFAGVEEVALRCDFAVLLGDSAAADPVREEACFDQVASGRADGIITGSIPASYVDGKRPLPPIVSMLERCPEPSLPLVHVDDRSGAVQATRHLIELGHRRIAHIRGHRAAPSAARRLEGFRSAMEAAGLEVGRELIEQGDFSVVSGAEAMEPLMSLADRPTAVFCGNDEMAYGAVYTLHKLGLRVPEDVSIVGYDDQNMAAYYHPPLTTVHIPRHEVGRRAAQELIDMLQGRDVAHEVVLPTRLIVRQSTAPPAARRGRRSG